MAGQANIAFDAAMEMYRGRNMAGRADITFDAAASLYAVRNMAGQANIGFNDIWDDADWGVTALLDAPLTEASYDAGTKIFTDLSSYARTLTSANAAAFNTLASGLTMMNFNGTTDLVDAGVDMIGTGDVTVEAWARWESTGEGGNGILLCNNKFFLGNNYQLRLAVTRNLYGSVAVGPIPSVQLNIWYHIVVTSTAAGVTNIYLNGALLGAADQDAGTPQAAIQDLFIGNRSGAASNTFDGDISGVRVYDGIPSEPAAFARARYIYDLPRYNTSIFLDRVLRMWANRGMAGQADISLDALMAMYAERAMTGQADIEFTPYLFMGIDGDTGLITRY